MGQHKNNPTAIAAKNGELPEKPPKKSKREMERELRARVHSMVVGSIFRQRGTGKL